MEDETSGKESTLIMGRPFLMTTRTKIDVHAGTLSMEFDGTLVQFNIFEAMKHPTKDHSLFGIDLLDEIVEEYFQLNSSSVDIENFAGSTDEISCLGTPTWTIHSSFRLSLPITSARSRRTTHKATIEETKSDHLGHGQKGSIIYPISDSQWVSPAQVVSKKSRMTVTKNQHDELVPMRIQNSWQVSIDYRRLNQATRKDHFPLPFID
ncbi:hypothetical protein CR513_51441, partial [Mucuna pruriens]